MPKKRQSLPSQPRELTFGARISTLPDWMIMLIFIANCVLEAGLLQYYAVQNLLTGFATVLVAMTTTTLSMMAVAAFAQRLGPRVLVNPEKLEQSQQIEKEASVFVVPSPKPAPEKPYHGKKTHHAKSSVAQTTRGHQRQGQHHPDDCDQRHPLITPR